MRNAFAANGPSEAPEGGPDHRDPLRRPKFVAATIETDLRRPTSMVADHRDPPSKAHFHGFEPSLHPLAAQAQ